ncbi:MAG: pyrroline-5-carboxylate reductase [Coriobacteriales bacterium]|nr:pyrroline-5-carboxylate reductase [Coriobacteriales bacterium]
MTDDIASRLGTIAFIGGGKMGEAIISGLVNGALFDPTTLIVAETSGERRTFLEETYGIVCVEDGTLIEQATTCLFAIKPQIFKEVAAHLSAAESFNPERIISIAAGVTTKTIQEYFSDAAVIRVMPNTPLMVGAGMSAVAVAEGTPPSEGELVCKLFSLIGDAVMLDESLINAATAINGSGPAYFARFVLELAHAGERMGLDAKSSLLLAQQTMCGTARQLELGDMTPEELIAAVTSPGGTTQAALEAFDASGLEGVVNSAVQAAVKRAEELA